MLKLGVATGTSGDSLQACQARAQAVEAAGMDFITYGDSQAVFRDCYAVLTACALATSRIELGPMVTNPVTRLPIVTAGAMATLDEVSDGRAFMAIGAGASSVANASIQRAKPKELAAAIALYRSAFRAAPGKHYGPAPDADVVSINWAKRQVPAIVHASGPLGMRVAAEWGDAVLLRLGDVGLEQLAERIAGIRALHAAGPRADAPFYVWIYSPAAVGDEVRRAKLAGIVAARSVTLKPEECPPDMLEALQRYAAGYDYKYHASTEDTRNIDLLRSLGIADYMADRFSLSGDRYAVAEKLARLEAMGVSRVLMQIGELGDDPSAITEMGAMAGIYRAAAG
jgi:5,10-methylenetetrahydromethanopterin reductase